MKEMAFREICITVSHECSLSTRWNILQLQLNWNSAPAPRSNKMLSYRRETALQGTLVLAERGRLELVVRFNSLSYVHIVHTVQNTVDSCINSATDRCGHLAHLYRRHNPYPNPSLVLGGVCRSATTALHSSCM